MELTMSTCSMCGVEFTGRKDAKFCSPKCRVTFSRKGSVVTDNVTVKPNDVTDNLWFEFYTVSKANASGRLKDVRSATRKAKYWYDVPLGAVPVLKDGYPEMPEYMNGRQYFLWWKNDFKTQGETPEIVNPYPVYDKLEYVRAGQDSRRWGA